MSFHVHLQTIQTKSNYISHSFIILIMGKKGKAKKEEAEENEVSEDVKVETNQQQEQTTEQKNQQNKPQVELLKPKKVQYCPICTFPFELCKYGKKATECKNFLMEIAPTKVSKYHPDGNDKKIQQQGSEKDKLQKKQIEVKQAKQDKQKIKKQKSVKDKYILIDVKNREKRQKKSKYICQISGLSIFKIDTKQLSKKLSKKFASSCSAIDEDKIQILGDFFDDIKEILVNEYNVKKKYILDKQQFKEKVGEEKQKKKEKKKLQENVIIQKPEQQEKGDVQPEQMKPKNKTQIQAMLEGVSDDDEQNN